MDYSVLFILTGDSVCEKHLDIQAIQSIVTASKLPISIIIIGGAISLNGKHFDPSNKPLFSIETNEYVKRNKVV